MSDKDDAPLEFSALDLMPSWAQETTENKPAKTKYRDHDGEDRGSRGRRGGGKFERSDRRQGRDGRGGGRDFRGGGDRRGGGGGDRRGGGGRDFRGGGDRRGAGGGDRRGKGGRFDQRRDEPFEIKGLKASFEPTEEAVKGLSKHIQDSVKAFPVGDLARMIASARERYQIRLKADDNGPTLYQCKSDNSAWLSRDEAVRNILSSPNQLKEYYAVEEVELEAPKGNFSTIAVCGFSGEILGPPNHHEYQSNIARLHREKFSNMSIERYKQRIQTESGEEIVEKWKEKVSKTQHYRLKPDPQDAPVVVGEAAAADEPKLVEAVTEPDAVEEAAVVDETPATEEEPTAESAAAEVESTPDEGAEAPAGEEEAEPVAEEEATSEAPDEKAAAAPAADEGPVFKTLQELEMHFRQNFAADEITEGKEVVILGNVPGKKLSADLLSLIKYEGKKLRKGFPFEMFQAVCNSLEKEGLKFFKRGKKALHVSLVRPQAISPNLSLTDRIMQIVTMVTDKPGTKTLDVIDSLCESFQKPDPKDKEAKVELDDDARDVLKDIRWLAMEGFIVEFPDTRLEIGKKPNPDGAQKPQQKKSAKAKKGKKTKGPRPPVGACTFTIGDLEKKAAAKAKRKPKPKPAKVPPGACTFTV